MRTFVFLLLLGSSSLLAQGQVVAKRPQPPQAIMAVDACSPKETWVSGHWRWDSDQQQYQWVPGRCVRTPRGKQYLAGSWQLKDQGWIWLPGKWVKL
jgi:hypothetical protein